ncbi:uncharacterized protein HKW66_Vig0030990 [Vigna angularis]|uniref:Uncharacterized protein n=1 Tax=Phaseolus angularis TaxID=3914 RepID=A0A8T0L7Z7_PHAAN|nr:uncharacterized protein HKW66_Vig0030990 [Vigna angularis]
MKSPQATVRSLDVILAFAGTAVPVSFYGPSANTILQHCPLLAPPPLRSSRLPRCSRPASVAAVEPPPSLLPREDSLISRGSCNLVPLSLRCRGSSPPAFIAATFVVVVSLVSSLLPSPVLPSRYLNFVNEASTFISF